MNEDLYRDMCLVLSNVTHISAKRLLEGDISSTEIAQLECAYVQIEQNKDRADITFLQSCRLSVDETHYFSEGKDFPFDEFARELDRRLQYLIFIETTFIALAQEVSLRMNIDTYKIMKGNITEAQKIEIRLLLSQIDGYQKNEIELFLDELKKRKDNQ